MPDLADCLHVPVRRTPGKSGALSSHELCTVQILLFSHLHKHYALHASDCHAEQHRNSWGVLE